MDQHSQTNKEHRKTRVGKTKKQFDKGKNPKAFAPASGRRAEKQARRNVEKDQTRLHVPAVDRTFGGHGGGQGKSSTVGITSADDEGPPPVIVAVVGPPGVGKTTLIRSLVRRYTKTTLAETKGPVTIVSGKQRRLTLIECPNEMGAMVDIAKIADLVLLVIDGSFGFEMETFECLSALASHGMPKIIAILTHLDLIKKPAQLRAQKKKLKNRFWTELYDGAKLFYLSGVINGRYPDREILNLSRFIATAKFRPLLFRNSHSYALVDRLEDITPSTLVRQNPKTSRTVAIWGYLRGVPVRPPTESSSVRVHIPGSGSDAMDVTKMIALPDPCPLPTKDSEKRRKLSDKNRIIHAPMTGGVGTGIVFDGDRVWINTAGTFNKNEENDQEDEYNGEGEKMVMDLQDMNSTLSDGIKNSQIKLFSSSNAPISVDNNNNDDQDAMDSDLDDDDDGDEDEDEDDDSDMQDEDNDEINFSNRHEGRRRALSDFNDKLTSQDDDIAYADSDSDLELGELDGLSGKTNEEDEEEDDDEDDESDEEEGDDNTPQWKQNLALKAQEAFQRSQAKRRPNLMKLIYASTLTPEQVIYGEDYKAESTLESKSKSKSKSNSVSSKSLLNGKTNLLGDNDDDDDDDEELFKVATRSSKQREQFRPPIDQSLLSRWETDDMLDSIRSCFITGTEENQDENNNNNDDDEGGSDMDGDFEDLETGQTHKGADEMDQDDDGDEDNDNEDEESKKAKALAAKKEALKRKFDEIYDEDSEDEDKQDYYAQQKNAIAKRLEATRQEFADDDIETRAAVEGYRPGTYVRMEINNVPSEMVENFDPMQPLVVGMLLPHEETFGYVQVRIKKHRWHPKILKTNDPLIVSLGWRRFQVTPIYSLDDGTRNRMLKYTPEHMHCLATFWGPISAPNVGLCAFNSMGSSVSSFRISATGVVTQAEGSSRIVKKLKLTGYPFKIFKNTAFVKEMFNSSLEVAKFEGANIRTVSGIRGQIKKALPKPDGAYRATFEDKVLMSDIIFLRAWYMVQPRQYYNPLASLLLQDKSSWKGMRLTGEVRRDENIKTPSQVNSNYKTIERSTRRFNKLQVPRKLQAALPYASKPKIQKAAKNNKTYMQKRAVVMEPEEKKTLGLLAQMQTVQREKVAKRKGKKNEQRQKREKELAKQEEHRSQKHREEKREKYREMARKKSKTSSK